MATINLRVYFLFSSQESGPVSMALHKEKQIWFSIPHKNVKTFPGTCPLSSSPG